MTDAMTDALKNCCRGRAAGTAADGAAGKPAADDTAKVIEDIGMIALYLAERARAAGLSSLGFLLETAALEAGAEAAARRWPSDAAQK